jgi:hypothetical protein
MWRVRVRVRTCHFVVAAALGTGLVSGLRIDAAVAAELPTLAVPVLAEAPPTDGSIGPAWDGAARASLTEDFTNRRPAGEATTVRIGQDGSNLDVAFDVSQHEPVVAATVTNGASVTSDDYVEVALSPNGPQGFQYAFYANPRGARYQTSSENSAYAPPWGAAVRSRPGGYTVTLRIPLAIVRSGGRMDWRAQFARATVGANALDVWAFDARASNAGDATFFGTLTGIGAQAKTGSARPRARAQIYGLGELGPKDDGGNTSRVGADFALPIAPTTSLLASFHPDYSNVETDQQTISPTAFPRQYAEVRPFFSQAGQPFNTTFSCTNCPQLLYTPAIPSYRDAYAVEGTQGPFTYGSFDVDGTGRNDAAATLDFNLSNSARALVLAAQNVTVNEVGGIRDEVTSLATGYLNQHTHFGAYLDYGDESGTFVADAAEASYLQSGFVYVTATTTGVLDWNHLGEEFAPLDAYVPQNDVNGPQLYLSKTIPFKAQTILHDLSLQTFDAAFENHAGVTSQNDLTTQLNVDFHDLATLHLYYNETAVRTYADELLPFDGSGALIGYKFATATPDYIEYSGGPYYHGELDAWTYIATIPLANKAHLALETDRDSYFTRYPGEAGGTQWLERASLDFQFNRETQFDVGARRLIGPNLPVSFAPPDFTPINAGNFSAAFHYVARSGRSEIYVVYGDPNSLSTTPALFVKYIRYIGAPKGT